MMRACATRHRHQVGLNFYLRKTYYPSKTSCNLLKSVLQPFVHASPRGKHRFPRTAPLRGQLQNKHAAKPKTDGLLIRVRLITCLPTAADAVLMGKQRNTHEDSTLGKTLGQMIWLGLITITLIAPAASTWFHFLLRKKHPFTKNSCFVLFFFFMITYYHFRLVSSQETLITSNINIPGAFHIPSVPRLWSHWIKLPASGAAVPGAAYPPAPTDGRRCPV